MVFLSARPGCGWVRIRVGFAQDSRRIRAAPLRLERVGVDVAMLSSRFHLRAFRRFPVHCSVYYSSDEFQGTGTAWNLSLSGWRVDGSHPVPPGAVVTLCVFLPDHNPTVFIDQAVVRWSRGQEFGVEVTSMKPVEQAHLRTFLSALM